MLLLSFLSCVYIEATHVQTNGLCTAVSLDILLLNQLFLWKRKTIFIFSECLYNFYNSTRWKENARIHAKYDPRPTLCAISFVNFIWNNNLIYHVVLYFQIPATFSILSSPLAASMCLRHVSFLLLPLVAWQSCISDLNIVCARGDSSSTIYQMHLLGFIQFFLLYLSLVKMYATRAFGCKGRFNVKCAHFLFSE